MFSEFVQQCLDLYKRSLLDDVVPFWMRHGVDPEHGALLNCLDDSGKVLSRDRYLWSQGRGLWTFSALYNRIDQKPEWLDVAHGIASYLKSNGRDAEGRWMYRLSEGGEVLDRDISIYVDGFILNGLSEYILATRDAEARVIALETYENVDNRIRTPGSYGIAPYELAKGVKTLGIPMIFSFFYCGFAKAIQRPDIYWRGVELAQEVFGFYDSERDALLEFASAEGGRAGIPEGSVSVPGHAIEAMWFLISIFEETGDYQGIHRCCELIRRHIELGWDEEYGGIRLAVDVDGKEPVCWRKADYKPWWVQVEALIATAYAYLHTRDDLFIEWHRAIRDYAFSHYPVATGEWTQWLDRTGRKGDSAALPVKDPFHLPRALIYLIEIFSRLGSESGF